MALDVVHPDEVTRTLMIVDDHAGFRAIARTILTLGGFEVTAEVADGESALCAVAAVRPEVVLLDVQLPGMDGFEVARRLSALPDSPAVVLCSSRSRASYADCLAATPARGFIRKEDLSADIVTSLLG